MRTVDPLGRHDDCTRILEAVGAGQDVMLVGHPLLGSEAVRRRVTHAVGRTPALGTLTFQPGTGTLAPGVRSFVSDDGSLDTRREVAATDPERPIAIVRLGRLTRRQLDRLADDRLARAGRPADWLGSTARSIIHAMSRGYPLLAAALLDDQLRPDRPPRAELAASAIVRALDPQLRIAAEIVASVRGVRTARAVEHLGADAVESLVHIGVVEEIAGALIVPEILRVPLTRRTHDLTSTILAEIAQGWSRRDAGTASEYIAAHEGIERGLLSTSPSTRAHVAALAACSLVGRSLAADASAAATSARALDDTLLPRALAAIAAGETEVAAPLVLDVQEAGFDDFSSRVLSFVIAGSVLAPERAAADLADLLPEGSEPAARLRRIGHLEVAIRALARGDHETVATATEAALRDADPLVSARAYGLLASDAAFRGDASGVLAAADGVHGVVAHVQDWTRTVLAVVGRSIAETRMAARAIALPPVPLLEAALDRVVEIAATMHDSATIAFAMLSRHVEVGTAEHGERVRQVLDRLPDERPRQQSLAALDALQRGPAALAGLATQPSILVLAGLVAEAVAAAETAVDDEARAALERCEALGDHGVPPTVPGRIAAAALRARLGLEVPSLDDVDLDRLSPMLRALAVLVRSDTDRDAAALLDAASRVVSARHAVLTEMLLAAATTHGADASSVQRLRDDLAGSHAAAGRTLRGSRSWVDRDVLGLAAAGLTDLQISQLLDLPLGTVRSRSRSVMAGLGIPSRAALASLL